MRARIIGQQALSTSKLPQLRRREGKALDERLAKEAAK